MSEQNNRLLLEVALDLANSLNNEDRFDRLLTSVRKAIRCDAVVLLGLHQDVLTPLAAQGLSADTMGRRFALAEHPRLQQLCLSAGPHRFASDCPLPDPYDGLLLARSGDLPVFNFGPDIETLRTSCAAETGLPAPAQPIWHSAATA